jgi:hypothetical protein
MLPLFGRRYAPPKPETKRRTDLTGATVVIPMTARQNTRANLEHNAEVHLGNVGLAEARVEIGKPAIH